MPIYEYKCRGCDKVFEELFFSEPQEALPCPNCSSTETEKIMSVTGVGSSSASEPACASNCTSPESCCSGGSCPMR